MISIYFKNIFSLWNRKAGWQWFQQIARSFHIEILWQAVALLGVQALVKDT